MDAALCVRLKRVEDSLDDLSECIEELEARIEKDVLERLTKLEQGLGTLVRVVQVIADQLAARDDLNVKEQG